MADGIKTTPESLLQEYWYCCSFLLPGGKSVIIDIADLDYVSRYRWLAVRSGDYVYARRNMSVGSKPVLVSMHRELIDAGVGEVIDHRNRNTLDNRRLNLRRATKRLNAANAGKRKDSKHLYKGVFYNKACDRWSARIRIDGKRYYIGAVQNTQEDAARTYDSLARLHFGEFAVVNFPE